MKYLFELGRETELAKAELTAVLSADIKLEGCAVKVMLAESTIEIDSSELIDRLGGTIKIGRLLTELPKGSNDDIIVKTLAEILRKTSLRNFGISLFGEGFSLNWRDKIGLAIKKMQKTLKHPARYVASKDLTLGSVQVSDQLKPGKGIEFWLIKSESSLLVGETIAIQDWKKWSRLDYGRPARDPERGMLPPKLARIMLNLSQLSPTATLLDPFCGVGTILAEATQLGFKNLSGRDRDLAAINASKENLAWLAESEKIILPEIDLGVASIETLKTSYFPSGIDGIVTEADLGPNNLNRFPPEERVSKFIPLEDLYEIWLKAMHNLLKPDGVLVLAYPMLMIPKTILNLPIRAQQIGWHLDGPTMNYARADQTIGRSIIILRK